MDSLAGLLNNYSVLLDQLQKSLINPLPGETAQRKMMPMLRAMRPAPGDIPRLAAVLLLLYPAADGISLLFTLRAPTLTQHSGEISLPGGRAEPGDSSLAHTALRETEEEIGLPATNVRLLGALTPLYIPPSRNWVHPFLGWLPDPPVLQPNPAEVARIIHVPLATLFAPHTIGCYEWQHEGIHRTAPCYQIADMRIWGATAMIVSELLEVLSNITAG